MAIRQIARLGEPLLREPTRELSLNELKSPSVQELIDHLIATMRAVDGVGIAAPQVRERLRLFVVEVTHNPRYPSFEPVPLTIFANPVVDTTLPADPPAGEGISIYEGCLSVPGLRGRVRRPRLVRVRALDREGRAFELIWEGVRAAIVQHENDHLHGTLFVDRADPRTLSYLDEYDQHVPPVERVVDRS